MSRQSIYSRLAGYEDTNDAERLAEDPTFRMLASRERRETSVALTSTLHWFETEVLAEARNYRGLSRLNMELVQGSASRPPTRRVTLDIDSSESPVHGAQEQSAYNGHFESFCYHPLFVFNQDGDCLAATLRPGNVHSADGWEEVLLPVIDRRSPRQRWRDDHKPFCHRHCRLRRERRALDVGSPPYSATIRGRGLPCRHSMWTPSIEVTALSR